MKHQDRTGFMATTPSEPRRISRDGAVLALLAVALMAPSLVWGPAVIDSSIYNRVWTSQFADALAHGQAYPRWLARSFEGMGSPTFFFYPPLAFYLAGGFAAAGLGVGQGINAAALLVTFLSGVTMRLWLGGRSSRPLLWSCLYMAAPYHMADWYLRAALAEYSAFVWLPLVALGIERLQRPWGPPLLAVSYAALVFTHLPMALLTSLGLIAPALIKSGAPWNIRRLAVGGAAILTGLAIAAVYLVPALALQRHIASDLLWMPYFQPQNWSVLSTTNAVHPVVRSWPHFFVATLVVLSAGGLYGGLRSRGTGAIFWAGLGLVTAVLALGVPIDLWTLPIVSKVQFPWRILAITEFAAVSAIAMVRRPSPVLLAFVGAFALSPYAATAKVAGRALRGPHNYVWVDVRMPDAVEYLPAGISRQTFDFSERLPDWRPLRGPIVWGAESVDGPHPDGRLTLDVRSSGRVVVRRFFFPSWQVVRDGRPVPVEPFGPGRLISFQAEPGRYDVVWAPLLEERIGWVISLAGVAGFGGLVAPLLIDRKRPPAATATAG